MSRWSISGVLGTVVADLSMSLVFVLMGSSADELLSYFRKIDTGPRR